MTTVTWAKPGDLPGLQNILDRTANFLPDEVEVARELIYESVGDAQTTYQTLVAHNDAPVGYVCFGRTPMTDHTFDLYWIVVDAALQGHGIGRLLYAEMEKMVREQNGKLIRIETSSSEGYDATQAFYHRLGFDELSHIKDFYRDGDALITFVRYLS
jgi:ribosomal protein S18 acetylase RimI-like enzyme